MYTCICVYNFQPGLNELPVSATDGTGAGRKRDAEDGENTDPDAKPPEPKQPRTIEIELPSNTQDDSKQKGKLTHTLIDSIIINYKPLVEDVKMGKPNSKGPKKTKNAGNNKQSTLSTQQPTDTTPALQTSSEEHKPEDTKKEPLETATLAEKPNDDVSNKQSLSEESKTDEQKSVTDENEEVKCLPSETRVEEESPQTEQTTQQASPKHEIVSS